MSFPGFKLQRKVPTQSKAEPAPQPTKELVPAKPQAPPRAIDTVVDLAGNVAKLLILVTFTAYAQALIAVHTYLIITSAIFLGYAVFVLCAAIYESATREWTAYLHPVMYVMLPFAVGYGLVLSDADDGVYFPPAVPLSLLILNELLRIVNKVVQEANAVPQKGDE